MKKVRKKVLKKNSWENYSVLSLSRREFIFISLVVLFVSIFANVILWSSYEKVVMESPLISGATRVSGVSPAGGVVQKPFCGDGKCDSGENINNCLDDCSNGPFIVYHNTGYDEVRFINCHNADCSSFSGPKTIISGDYNGMTNSIAIGIDENPFITYYGDSSGGYLTQLNSVHCEDKNCDTFSERVLDSDNNAGMASQVFIGRDGFPLIEYLKPEQGDRHTIIHCNNIDCPNPNNPHFITDPNTNFFGGKAIKGKDGFLMLAFTKYVGGVNLFSTYYIKCNDINCSSHTNPILIEDSSGLNLDIEVGNDGNPVFVYTDKYSNKLYYHHCNDVNCSSETIKIIQTSTGNLDGRFNIEISDNGSPAIIYRNNVETRYLRCDNVNCDNIILDKIIATNSFPGDMITFDGLPFITFDDPVGMHSIRCLDWNCNQISQTYLDNYGAQYSSIADLPQ